MCDSMCDTAEIKKLLPSSGSSNFNIEQDETSNKDESLANTNTNSQTPADMDTDKTIKVGNDNTDISLNSPKNLIEEETQTEAKKHDFVLKLQPLSDIDINIWSNRVGQYHTSKRILKLEPPTLKTSLLKMDITFMNVLNTRKTLNSLCP